MNNTPNIDWKIISKKIDGTISESEEIAFQKWIQSSEKNRKYYKDSINFRKNALSGNINHTFISGSKQRLNYKIKKQRNKKLYINILKYTAIFIIPIISGLFLLLQNNTKLQQRAETINAISPKAYLTLSSGQKVYISNITVMNGITEDDGTTIKRNKNSISYKSDSSVKNNSSKILYNKLYVPKGGEYQMTLADGTAVWLNSGSTIKFPVKFGNKNREVKLEGEAFFKVKKDTKRPFIVKTEKGDIRVLGTSFNVFAYKNFKTTHTTLVEGKIEYSDKNGKQILNPGEQIIYTNESNTFQVRKVNTSIYTAWKNGLFVFEEENLEAITDKLSLWYGVDFFFMNEDIKNYKFSGHMKRYENFTDILKLIENVADVRFKIKGKAITVFEKK